MQTFDIVKELSLSSFLIPMPLQPNVEDLRYFKQ